MARQEVDILQDSCHVPNLDGSVHRRRDSVVPFSFRQGAHLYYPAIMTLELLQQLFTANVPNKYELSGPRHGRVLPLVQDARV